MNEAQVPVAGRTVRVLTWMRVHWIKTAILLMAGIVVVELGTIPWFAIPSLATEAPAETALMRQRRDEALDGGRPLSITKRWIALSRLPRYVTDAVIVAEDGTFYVHGGIDWFEVEASFEKNWKTKRFTRGASTITQQLAKNLYLSTSKDPVRKLKEVVITLLLEHYLTKDRILELYLNNIEWGRGVFGIETAAQKYFGKSASRLTLDEATRLAAVIPSPLRHRPDDDSRYVLRRKNIVIARLQARNKLPTTQEDTTDQDMIPSGIAPGDSAAPADSLDFEEEEPNGL